MTGDHDIAVTVTLCRGEHRIQNRNGPPIREEVTLIEPRPRMSAKIKPVIDSFLEGEVTIGSTGEPITDGSRLKSVEGPLSGVAIGAESTKEPTSLRGWCTGLAVSFPNGAIAPPVRNERTAKHILDTA